MEEIILAIKEVQDEMSLPKAVKLKLEDILAILEGPGDIRLKASKVMSELEELTDNQHIPSFIRTQLWNIASMLETV